MSATDQGYLFGCCAACRALFEPSTRDMMAPESQAWAYLIARVDQVALAKKMKTQLTGEKHRSHFVARAKYQRALGFAVGLDGARISVGLPSNFDRADDKRGMFCSKVTEANPSSAARDPVSGLDNSEIVEAVQEAQQAASSAGDPAEFARIIVDKVSDSSDGLYYATWAKPSTGVRHARLTEWLNSKQLRDVQVDLNRITSCCSLCNSIWDCRGRMRDTLQDAAVIAKGKVSCRVGKKKTVLKVPSDTKTEMQTVMGSMIAYYLHAGLGYLSDNIQDAPYSQNLVGTSRQTVVTLLWLPMHVNCMFRELQNSVASPGDASKGYHNYVGCLELLMSYYCYTCACADPTLDLHDVPFEMFHVFYFKELSEMPSWNRGHRVDNFVFGAPYALTQNYAAQISHVSDKLQELYEFYVHPVLKVLTDPDATDRDVLGYFATPQEVAELTRDYLQLSAASPGSTQLHLAQAGVHAVTWQLRRALADEAGPILAGELDRWTNARMQVEWRNVAARLGGADFALEDAQLIYYAQHTLAPPDTGGLLAIASKSGDDQDGAVAALRRLGLCSPWKAAARLRRYQFTAPASPADEEEADDEGLAGLGSSLRLLRITSSPRQRAASTARRSARARPASAAALGGAGMLAGRRSTA